MRYTFPGVIPKQAEKFVKDKKLKPGFNYQDVFKDEHINNFTVAKAMKLDVLADLQLAVQDAISQGITLQQFKKDLKPLLQRKGWWGIKEMQDPVTGKIKKVQLGTPRRLRTIYDTNVRQARAVEVYENTMRNKAITPYFKYNIGPSLEHRPEHAGWNNVVLPVDDAFWNTHFAPNGYGCKCHITAVTQYDYDKNQHKYQTTAPKVETREFTNTRTGEVMRVPKGIDPGFDYNAGKQKRQWDKYGHLPDCTGVALNAFAGKNPCAKRSGGQKPWQKYGLKDINNVDKKYQLPAPKLLPRAKTELAALWQLEKAVLGDKKVNIVRTPIHNDVIIKQDMLSHIVKKRRDVRERYANFIIPTLKDPYEVWLPKYKDGSMRPNYIGLFDTESDGNILVIIKENRDGTILYNAIPVFDEDINDKRIGILLYNKEKHDTKK